VLALLLIKVISSNAQSFKDGDNLFFFGFGLAPGKQITNQFNIDGSFIDYKLNNFGAIHLKYERGLHEYLGFGANLEYTDANARYKYDFTDQFRYEVKQKSRVIGLFGRMNGYYPVTDVIDLNMADLDWITYTQSI